MGLERRLYVEQVTSAVAFALGEKLPVGQAIAFTRIATEQLDQMDTEVRRHLGDNTIDVVEHNMHMGITRARLHMLRYNILPTLLADSSNANNLQMLAAGHIGWVRGQLEFMLYILLPKLSQKRA